MLDHFRILTIEATQLESNNQSLESEARSTRAALRNAESKVADLQHVIQNKDALIHGYEEQVGSPGTFLLVISDDWFLLLCT